MTMAGPAEQIQAKWKPILEHADLGNIKDPLRRHVTAQMLENTQRELGIYADHSQFLMSETVVAPTNSMGLSSSTAGTGNIDTFDPVLISLVRRAMPNLVAYDIAGVQPMTGPTGLIFAMRSRYAPVASGVANSAGPEAFYYEANTGFASKGGANATANTQTSVSQGNVATNPGGGSNNVGSNTTYSIPVDPGGGTPAYSNLAGNSAYNYSGALKTFTAEGLGGSTTTIFPEMSFSIEKVMVEAGSRALKAEYSMELAQDLKAIHGLDAETELSNILSVELLAEINREVVRAINVTAVSGSQRNVTTVGNFDLDVDSNGRWLVEKYKGLMMHLETEANQIAKDTRRGKGNIIICTSDVASALQMAGVLDYTPALNSNSLSVDDTGNTFAGVLNGRFRVYIDPYALGGDYATLGYKGSNPFDAGLFYCPYVPLQMVRAVDPNTFQPKIGFKTRYGMVANPFAQGATKGSGALVQDSNVYYRRSGIANLM
jgi:hypothetical protein